MSPVNVARHAAPVAVICCVLLTVAVVPVLSSGVTWVYVKELRIGFVGQVDSLNPFLGLTEEAWLFYSLIYDSLQSVDEDLNPTSNLATDLWVVPITDPMMVETGEPYGSVWQYNLTRNAMWHDGTPLTADDVVFSMNLNCRNFTDLWAFRPYSYFMDYAEKVGDHSVRIHYYDRATGEPMPAAYGYMLSVPVLPQHKFLEMGITAAEVGYAWPGTYEDSNPPIVGTGPYMATSSVKNEWMSGDRLTLVRNANYHFGADKGLNAHFDKIVMNFYDDVTAMKLALTNDQLDIACLSPSVYDALATEVQSGMQNDVALYHALKCNGDAIVASFSIGGTWWGPNPNEMIRDPTVRKALSQAIDRRAIIDDVLFGYAEEGSTIISPMSAWHYEPSPDERVDFDPEAAAEILEESGYVDIDSDGVREATIDSFAVKNGLVDEGAELELVVGIRALNTPEHDIAKTLGAQWSDVGVSVSAYQEAYLDALCPWGPYDVGIAHRNMDVDPIYSLIWCSKREWGGWADSKWLSNSYEENFNCSVRAMDGSTRHAYVDECQRIHYAEMPQIVLAYPHSTYAIRTEVYNESQWGNWTEHPGLALDNLWGAHPLLFRDFSLPEDGGWQLPEWILLLALCCLIVASVVGVLVWRKLRQPVR